MGFLDWLHLGRDWMLYHVGGYPGLVAYFLLALIATLTVAHIARWVRMALDARKRRGTLRVVVAVATAVDERIALKDDVDAAIEEVERLLGICRKDCEEISE